MHDPNSKADTERIRTDYEKVPYPGGAFLLTKPDNLSVRAAMAGFPFTPVDHCRVLDIGCAIGRNIIAIAQGLPGSYCLGIDLSASQIAAGQEIIRSAGLTNIELRAQDVMEFEPDEPFDYIIAHGVYSWVPPQVRDGLMKACVRSLSPTGLLYVSYNTMPGWHLQNVLKDMIRHHCAGETEAAICAAKAREILGFASQPSQAGASIQPYKDFVRGSNQVIADKSDWYLTHEYLESFNQPVYLKEFVQHAGEHGLSYIDDAGGRDATHLLPPAVQEQLHRFAKDEIGRQQYLDFLDGRAFRASVLCRSDARRATTAGASVMPAMHVAGRLTEETFPDPSVKNGPVRMLVRFGNRATQLNITFNDAGLIAAFRQMKSAWPHAVGFVALRATVLANLPTGYPPDIAASELAEALLLAYRLGIVELWTRPTDFLAIGNDRPHATPLARLQVVAGDPLVNLRHEQIPTSAAAKTLLPLMDGTRDRAALLRELQQAIERRELNVQMTSGLPSAAPDLNAVLDSVLNEFHASSLLASQGVARAPII